MDVEGLRRNSSSPHPSKERKASSTCCPCTPWKEMLSNREGRTGPGKKNNRELKSNEDASKNNPALVHVRTYNLESKKTPCRPGETW